MIMEWLAVEAATCSLRVQHIDHHITMITYHICMNGCLEAYVRGTLVPTENVFSALVSNKCCQKSQYMKYLCTIFSERELKFRFAICHQPSVCLSSVRLSSVCRLSVMFVRPTQAIEIFGNVSTPYGTLTIY